MPESLPVRRAAAVVIERDGAFLAVRRPSEDPILGDVWGLPAVDMSYGEDWHTAAIRIGREKLGVELEIGKRLGEDRISRKSFVVHLVEFEAQITAGEPSVPQADQPGTQYIDLAYSEDPTILFEAAQRGSACSRIFLQTRGIPW